MADVDRADLREQFVEAFEGADYPITGPFDLLPALPRGPTTRFESGDFSMTAMELHSELSGGNFPYEDVESFVDDVMARLDEEQFI